MFIDFQQRVKVMKGFMETRIYIGDDAEDVGRDCALLMESMVQSENDTEKGKGEYDTERSN
ncbi:hypothetical protein MASR1M48_16870 [Lactococcus petauri]